MPKKEFFRKFIGKKVAVLIETGMDRSADFYQGITSSYVPVVLRGENRLKNTLITVRIEGLHENNALFGTLCSGDSF